jgi:small subunit ribosomal protein S3
MTIERRFIEEGKKRMLIREYLKKETERAGFGGLDIQRTPMGTILSMITERPGLVIGRGGKNIDSLTKMLSAKFDIENPQLEIEEIGNKASLNAPIMAQKVAAALERGWHFRRIGHSTVRRIMESGARGCQIIISGKITGARHRTEKFTQGHIKYCGETAKNVMDEAVAVAKKKLGVLGVKVRIMRPEASLPDEIKIADTAQPKAAVPEAEKKPVAEKPKAAVPEAEKKPVAEKPKAAVPESKKKFVDIPGVGEKTAEKLKKAGIAPDELLDMSIDTLADVDGIGKKTAKKIKESIKENEVTRN